MPEPEVDRVRLDDGAVYLVEHRDLTRWEKIKVVLFGEDDPRVTFLGMEDP